MSVTNNYLSKLRQSLSETKVDAFIVFCCDAHQSEYVQESDKRCSFISNFTGSACTALVLQTKALLWTDSRYFLQASRELSNEWTLMKSGEQGVLEINEWINENLSNGSVVAVDPFLISASSANTMMRLWKEKNIILQSTAFNPIDLIWTDRPSLSQNEVKVYDLTSSGKSHIEKISTVQHELKQKNISGFLISMLDEVAWLFNLRGSDIAYNPVFMSYAIIMQESIHLFINSNKVTNESKIHLTDAVTLHDYDEITDFLKNESNLLKNDNNTARFLLDDRFTNWHLYQIIDRTYKVVNSKSPIQSSKAIKNDIELNHIIKSHIRDGYAVTCFLHWLENYIIQPNHEDLTEYEAAVKLAEFRRQDKHFVSPSFCTISGYGPNGAVVHYRPPVDNSAVIGTESFFLLDSGGQYSDGGTTDITRTTHLGNPTVFQKKCFTYVLKGHIALANAVFPTGVSGHRLDSLARLPLWQAGLDYGHGTGHGVGAYLNVHEGPQGIGTRPRPDDTGLAAGMVTSIEPGVYVTGQFGVRIENLYATCPATMTTAMLETAAAGALDTRSFLRFAALTLVPLDRKCIDVQLLDAGEVAWLDHYHDTVREALLPLAQSQAITEYILRHTEPLL